MNVSEDAFGHACYDFLKGKPVHIIIERSDGYFNTYDIAEYFSHFHDWPGYIKQALKYAQGKVVDVGCGPGRHALYLQKQGYDVLGIDQSPLVIKVCKLRGLKKVMQKRVTQLNIHCGTFDTLLMLGANFGLCANKRRAPWLLKRFYALTSKQGRIILQSRNPYQTKEPHHLKYHRDNKIQGRMGGQIRLRHRYKNYIEPWYDYLFVSPQEMRILIRNTGWTIHKLYHAEKAVYAAILTKNMHA